MNFRACGLALALAALLSIRAAAAEPSGRITVGQAIVAFSSAVFVLCLDSRQHATSIAEMPQKLRAGFRPATAQERAKLRGIIKNDQAPVWFSDLLGPNLVIIERSPARCDVIADQLPVDETFKTSIDAAKSVYPDFVSEPTKPDYNPIIYQLERIKGGERYIVHMEGAEPGEPGHASRVSILQAWIVRQSVHDKPPWR